MIKTSAQMESDIVPSGLVRIRNIFSRYALKLAQNCVTIYFALNFWRKIKLPQSDARDVRKLK